MGKLLGKITNSNIVSRYEHLTVKSGVLIDNSIHASGEVVPRGALLAKAQVGGKYRAYFEGVVTTAFSMASAAFAVDPSTKASQFLRPGDKVEKTDATLLGTVLAYDPVTGIGTLTGNAAAALAVGQVCRLRKADYALNANQGCVLEDEILMDDQDEPVVGYFAGIFVQARTSITDGALSELGGVALASGEAWVK